MQSRWFPAVLRLKKLVFFLEILELASKNEIFLKFLKSHRKKLICSETFKNEVFGWAFFL